MCPTSQKTINFLKIYFYFFPRHSRGLPLSNKPIQALIFAWTIMRCQSLSLGGGGGGRRKETIVFCHHLWTSDDRWSFVVVKITSRALSSCMFLILQFGDAEISAREKIIYWHDEWTENQLHLSKRWIKSSLKRLMEKPQSRFAFRVSCFAVTLQFFFHSSIDRERGVSPWSSHRKEV